MIYEGELKKRGKSQEPGYPEHETRNKKPVIIPPSPNKPRPALSAPFGVGIKCQ